MINIESTAYCTFQTTCGWVGWGRGCRLVFMLHSFMFGERTVQHRDIICKHMHVHPGDFFFFLFFKANLC